MWSLRAARERPLARFAVALLREVADDDLTGMAAEMAYRFLFALAPLLLLAITVLGTVGDLLALPHLTSRAIALAGPLVPAAVAPILVDAATQVTSERSGGFLTLGALGTLWGAASGMGALLKGLNRAYDIDRPRPLWRRQAIGLVVALALPVIAVIALLVASAGRIAARTIASSAGLGAAGAVIIDALQLAFVGLAFFGAMSIVYQRLPNVRIRYRDALPGSALALVGLVAVSAGFGLYVDRTAGSAAMYTTFGAAFVFLIWTYLMSLLVLLGAELNALLGPSQRWRWSASGEAA